MKADIWIKNVEIIDGIRYTGIHTAIVGGKVVYENGKMTEECPGRWLGLGGRR